MKRKRCSFLREWNLRARNKSSWIDGWEGDDLCTRDGEGFVTKDEVDNELNYPDKENEDDRSEQLTQVSTNSSELESEVFEEL